MNRSKLKRKNNPEDKKNEKSNGEKSKEAETLSGYESDEVNIKINKIRTCFYKIFFF